MARMIIIDAGHSGPTKDPGAIGPTGLKECDVVLALAYMVKAGLMRRNIPVALTREMPDQPITDELSYRTDLSNAYAAAAFISLHCNAAERPDAEGAEIWTYPGQSGADVLAETMLGQFEKQMPGLYLRKDLSDGDGDKEARFYVLRFTDAPAILIEIGFISNPDEEKLLKDNDYLLKIAQVIIDGIVAWLEGE